RDKAHQACPRTPMPYRAVVLSALVCLIGTFTAPAVLAAPPAKVNNAELRIGAIVPESWPSAAQGQEIRNGLLLALKIWPGYPVPTLEVKDSACDPKRAQAAAQGFIDAKVDIVLGGWCVVGTVPALLKGAGVAYVSSNSERYASADAAAQFGRIGSGVAEGIAARLRSEVGLRVTANSVCWIDMEPRVSEKYDAALCPTLPIDKARWDEVAPTYSAAFQKPFTPSAARGYAAMQLALAYVTRLRAGAKPAVAWAEAQNTATVLGRLPARDAATPDEAMQLIFGAKLPKLPPREAAALDTLLKSKACGCKADAPCAANSPWRGVPFVVAGPNVPACAQAVVSSGR
ncbi:MAG TPA: ABC transporter substrate-binding protein, partial [Rhizobacter sp.]|nr:ABC transporter substrate-binding protein [Rhizobacter sp.]